MTGPPDQPTPATPVTDLLALLGQIPAEQAAQIRGLGIAVHQGRRDVPWCLVLPVATHQAARALADRLGLPRDDYEYDYYSASEQDTDPVTRWSGPWARWQDVQVTHDARENYLPRGPQDAQTLTGHLTRLHQALTALEPPHDASDVYRATVTAGGLHLDTTRTATARALAARLCPQATGQHHHLPDLPFPPQVLAPGTRWTSWEARCEDTTITGPTYSVAPTRHRTDADEDLP